MYIICSEVVNLGGGKFIPHSQKVNVPDKLGEELVARKIATDLSDEIEAAKAVVAQAAKIEKEKAANVDEEDEDGEE